jgi:hypothetical protein
VGDGTYVEVVTLPLELGGGVHLVRHDPGDGLPHSTQILTEL